ncbi:MAG TPA: hypothetical protein VEW07_03520 [Solirubrobacterales bacterium]|nr:hypothetical protein [Solirubrobacterales bacterium]
MTYSLDEAMRDRCEQETGVDVDVVCSDCGDAAIVRYLHGEPVDATALDCHCGGEFEPV